jgi:hypothetical protein
MRREDRERLLAEVLRDRAERLKVSVEQLGDLEDSAEPRFLKAARDRAERLGSTPEEVLRQDVERLMASRYPGPDCLEPEEVERFAAGGVLGEDDVLHVAGCGACQSLLQVLSPSEGRLEEFLTSMRPNVAARGMESGAREGSFSIARSAMSQAPSKGDLADLAGAALPVIVAGTAIYALPTEAPELALRAPWIPVLGAVAAVGLVVLFGLRFAARSTVGESVLLSSRGALLGGILVAVLGVTVVMHERSNRLNASSALAEYQLREFVLESMDSRQSGGRFLLASTLGNSVSLQSDRSSPNRAVYRAAARGVPGMLVADVSPDTGYLWWQRGNERELRASFVAGRVREAGPHSVVIEDASGANRVLRFGAGVRTQPNLKPGSFIIAALDSANAILKVQEVGESRP